MQCNEFEGVIVKNDMFDYFPIRCYQNEEPEVMRSNQ